MPDDPEPHAHTDPSEGPFEGSTGDDGAREAHIHQGGVREVVAEKVTITQGGAGTVRAQTVTVSQGGIGVAIADRVEVREGAITAVLAREVTGDARILVDLRAVAVAIVAFLLLRRLRR